MSKTSSYLAAARPLRFALLSNATFSTACAVAAFTSASSLGAHFAGAPSLVFQILAGGLVVFAASLVWQATRPNPPLFAVAMTIVQDALWVVGSVILATTVGGRFSELGLALFIGVGVVVAVLGAAQAWGLARLVREPDRSLDTTHRYELFADVDVPADDLWPVVSDLGAIHRFSASLVSSEQVGASGPGARRTCRNAAGACWSEEVVAWDEGRSLRLRFVSDEADFPFPMHPMIGGWRLDSLGPAQTRVTVWWSFRTRPVWAAPLIAAMLDRGARSDMTAVIRSMARAASRPVAGAPVAEVG